MNYSKMTVEEYKKIFDEQEKNKHNLFELLSNSNDKQKIEVVENISAEDFSNIYGIEVLCDEAKKYRLETLLRFLEMCSSSGLDTVDLVIRSHYNAIVGRLFALLGLE